MKKSRYVKVGILMALLMLVLGMTTVFAANAEKKLSQNKWVTQPDYNTYYKVTVKDDGYLTVSAKESKLSYGYINVDGYKKVGKNYNHITGILSSDKKSASGKFAVKKGTYYLQGTYGTQFKYTFTKAVFKENYCASKAIDLKSNKEVVVVNTPKKAYDRWYKIKLTKKQKLTFWSTGAGGASIFDSNMKIVDVKYDDKDDTKWYSSSKLKKGTYYVRISNGAIVGFSDEPAVATFKWK